MKIVAGVIGLLALIVVGSVSISITEETVSIDDVPEWSYDDYKLIDGAVSASGSLEMIDTYLGSMVHAVDVGPGSIVFDDGTSTNVQVQKAILDVYLFTGQSNSCYSDGDPSTATPVPNLGTSYAWMLENGVFGPIRIGQYAAFRPMVSTEGECLTADKAIPFAATVNNLTGHKVYFICGGWGDRTVSTFEPGGTTWTYMKKTVNEAMEAIDADLFDVNTCYYCWIQGEADKNTAIEDYIESFRIVNDAIQSGELGYTFSHCFISQINAYWGNPTIALAEIAETFPNVTMGSSAPYDFTVGNGLMGSDRIHYSQLGDNVVGVDLGMACAELRNANPSNPPGLLGMAPIILGIAVGVLGVTIAFRLIAGRD